MQLSRKKKMMFPSCVPFWFSCWILKGIQRKSQIAFEPRILIANHISHRLYLISVLISVVQSRISWSVSWFETRNWHLYTFTSGHSWIATLFTTGLPSKCQKRKTRLKTIGTALHVPKPPRAAVRNQAAPRVTMSNQHTKMYLVIAHLPLAL